MGWDVDLEVDGKIAQVTAHREGSNIAIGGSTDASMLVTYNYSKIYAEKLKLSVPDFLKDKTANDTIPFLRESIAILGTDKRTDNYWEASPGNARHILVVLLDWATQHPTGVWRISK